MARDWKGGNASTFKTIGASNHCNEDRADQDYYATEPAATDWLCCIEHFDGPILEPSCGEGHISRQLQKAGYEVVSRDLVDRGFGEVSDFLSPDNMEWNGDIVTNPPYAFAQEFVEKALAIIPDGRKVAMFLKLTFLEGKRRSSLFKSTPPFVCGSVARGSSAQRTETSRTRPDRLRHTDGLSGKRGLWVIPK